RARPCRGGVGGDLPAARDRRGVPVPGRVREAGGEEDTHATGVSAAVAGEGVAAAAPADHGVGSVDLRAPVSVEVLRRICVAGGAAFADATTTDAAPASHTPAAPPTRARGPRAASRSRRPAIPAVSCIAGAAT